MCTKSLERENSSCRSVLYEKRNHCTIFPAHASMVAENVEQSNQHWSVRTKVDSDLIIQIGENSFHLHKLPMVARSGYLNRLVFQRSSGDATPNILIDNLPGGSKIFELVVKFCYGMMIELTAANIAPLYCAAHILEMSDDLEQGNLISKTDAFLSFLIFSSWKDTFRIFKSCESISSWARELQILKRCSEAVAWKACMDPNAISSGNKEVLQCIDFLQEKENYSNPKKAVDNWWFKDLSLLRIDHFIEVIAAIKRKGIRSELVGSCVTHWTTKWLSRISLELDNPYQKHLTVQLHRFTIESLINVLPEEDESVSCNFLLHLLKVGMIVKVHADSLNKLERRIAVMLESCQAKDLLVKNNGYCETICDVGIVTKVVEAYVSLHSGNPSSRIHVVGRLVDEYLTLVARDENLPAKVFQLLVEALPKDSRYCDDNLYRAIDMYLKAHPHLTEEERSGICSAMEYRKLSQDARKHAMKNNRLPLNSTTRFILLEQINMTRLITADATEYRRTKLQGITRGNKSVGKGWMNSQKELKMMKQDVERIKVQLYELQLCRMRLQRHVNRGIIWKREVGFVRSLFKILYPFTTSK